MVCIVVVIIIMLQRCEKNAWYACVCVINLKKKVLFFNFYTREKAYHILNTRGDIIYFIYSTLYIFPSREYKVQNTKHALFNPHPSLYMIFTTSF